MAVLLDRRGLNINHRKWLASELTIKTEISGWQKRQFYSKSPPPFHFYVVEGDLIRVPYTVANTLVGKNVNIETRSYPKFKFKFKGELYNVQKPIAKMALHHMNEYGTSSLCVYTGFGKTVICAFLACELGLLPLVLIESTTLMKQWKETFDEFTDANVWVVGEKYNNKRPIDVIISMDGRLDKIPREYLDSVGFLIIDEAHKHCTPKKVSSLLKTRPKYIIAATATLDRDDGHHKMIHALCGTHQIFKKSIKPFIAYRFNTGIKVDIQIQGKESKWNALLRALCSNDTRNGYILGLILSNLDKKMMVLTRRVEHAKNIHSWLKQLNIKCDIMVGSKQNYSDSNVLVGTVEKLGTGFDERTCCANFNGKRIELLFIVISVAKQQLLEQVAGRAFRAQFPQIIYFVDSVAMVRSHWYKGKKWIESRNGIIKVMKPPKDGEKMPKLEKAEIIIARHTHGSTSTTSNIEVPSEPFNTVEEEIKAENHKITQILIKKYLK